MKITGLLSFQGILASLFVIFSMFLAIQQNDYSGIASHTIEGVSYDYKSDSSKSNSNNGLESSQNFVVFGDNKKLNESKPVGLDPINQSDLIPIEIESLPNLSKEILNVTSGAAGFSTYKFEHSKRLTLKYDEQKIPEGYSFFDIFTFRYDTKSTSWVKLDRLGVDLKNTAIVSEASKDGDFINGIIKTPEAPETQGYTPTTISEIEVADPTSMIQLIEAPKINSDGTANLSYPIDCPPGRHGIQPNLSINYNSDGGAGSLGEGWNLNGLSSISIDTRWGVPLYDNATETETYLLDGKMLVLGDPQNGDEAVLPHRSLHIPRTPEYRLFFERKESNFNKIERFGNRPSEYYWIVTEKKVV